MKKIFVTIIAIAALALASCSNKVDLYDNSGDSTVVYAILDVNADTTFFKITKSFVGNVQEMGLNYEANNYTADEIDVSFKGVFEGSGSTQILTLDTVSRWIPYNPESTFYSGCMQTYYYTTKKLVEGKEYTLNVFRKADSTLVTSKATTINKYNYQLPMAGITPNAILNKEKVTLKWNFAGECLASYLDVTCYFHYKELMPGAQDSVSRTITWSIKSGKADAFYNSTNNNYVCSFSPKTFFNVLEQDQYLNEHSPYGVGRRFEKFEYKVTAIGEELYEYYIVNNSSSAIQDTPNYTNVDNGVGLFGARVSKSIFSKIIVTDQRKIANDYPKFGFVPDAQ